jgi:DNA-binding response OmpR family regulator
MAKAKGLKFSGRKLLIADDDPEILAMLSLRFGRLGFEVIEAHDGNQALDMTQQHHPDLVLLDVMMPHRNGWEVARALRQDPELSATKIVVLTAIGERINELTSPMYEVDAYVDKPFEFTKLEEVIETTLETTRPDRYDVRAVAAARPKAKKAVSSKSPARANKKTTKAKPKARPKAKAKPKARRK